MSLIDGYAEYVTKYNKLLIALLLIATAIMGSAAGDVDSSLSISSFESNSPEQEKLDYIKSNFRLEGENTTAVQIVVRGNNTLSKESLIETLKFQRSLLSNSKVNKTLRTQQPVFGLSNTLAFAAIQQQRRQKPPSGKEGEATANNSTQTDRNGAPRTSQRPPTLDEQITALESLSEDELDKLILRVLDPEASQTGEQNPFRFLPTNYEGGTTSDARVMFVFQEAKFSGSEPPPEIVDAQLEIKEVANNKLSGESFAFGVGILDEEAKQATGDSFAIITPFAFLLVILILIIAYRDIVDVLLGLVGIFLVLMWMGGFMGWAGIGVTQILIAVPFLLIGLSIDYAIHVVMRYRENQGDETSVREAMKLGLSGVTVAIGAATFTTSVGFLSNLVSPIQSIQEFGLVSAVGIVSAFIVFGALIPAIKIEVDSLLEWIGLNRQKSAFGVDTFFVTRALSTGTKAAKNAPVAVALVALLVSAGGAYGATQIDTSINQEDFLPRDAPGWTDSLPESLQPGDYDIRENTEYLNDNFVQSRSTSRAEILIEGSVTDDEILKRLSEAEKKLKNTDTAIVLSSGRPDVDSPLRLVNRIAEKNETVANAVGDADTDNDGIPDKNIEEVFDAVYGAAPKEAKKVIYRKDGDYKALRMKISVRGDASSAEITEEMRKIASGIEGGDVKAIATGQPIVNEIVQKGLLRTLVETFIITLVVILIFLSAIFMYRYRELALGAVTIIPVVFALSWILGTMYLLGLPFNTETAVITSIAIGLGVDYTIHISERFIDERNGEDGDGSEKDIDEVLSKTIRGTGGALLASAATTATGFSVLGLALVPSLQRFGIVTGLTIVYAFLASVLVLPSLLTLWDRYKRSKGA